MNEDRFKRELEGLTSSRKFVQLSPGSEVQLRLVGDWEKQTIHFLTDIVEEDAPAKVALCTKESSGECVFCDLAEKLFNSINEEDQKIASRLVARKRYMWVAIVRGGEKGDYVAVLDVGPQCFVSLGEVKRDWGDFTDEKNGYDVIIKVSTEMGWNKYKAYASSTLVTDEHGNKTRKIAVTPLTDVEKRLIEEAGIDLAKMRTVVDPEEVWGYMREGIKSVEREKPSVKISQPKFEIPQQEVSQKKESPIISSLNSSKPKQTFNTKPVEEVVKRPRCFGQLYDASDEENCGRCPFRDACSSASQ